MRAEPLPFARQPWIALALVTTGPLDDAPLEVAAIAFHDTTVEDTFQALIRPPFPLPFLAQARTGLRPEDLVDALDLAEAAEALLRFCGPAPIVGWALDATLFRLGLEGLTSLRCDLGALALLLVPGLRDPSPTAVARALQLAAPRDRALPLAQLAHAAFTALRQRAANFPPLLRSELARLAIQAQHPARAFFVLLDRDTQAGLAPTPAAPAFSLGLRESDTPSALGPPPASPRPIPTDGLASLLGSDGPFSRRFPNYEERPQQVAMLSAVAKTLNEGGQLLVEAGTGTGKSLAYLLPALAFALENDTPVVIATHTINLQEQLYQKDLPDLIAALADTPLPGQRRTLNDVRAVLLKGRAHYLCPRRLMQWRRSSQLSPAEAHFLLRLFCWLPQTETGDWAELALDATEEHLWSRVNAAPDSCSATQCLVHQRGLCFLAQARRRAASAHLVITNHALLLADLAQRQNGRTSAGRVLPDHCAVIIDEAHHLEDEATRQFGFQLSNNRFAEFFEDVSRLLSATRDLLRASMVAPIIQEEAQRRSQELEQRLQSLLQSSRAMFASLGRLAREHAPDSGEYVRQLRLTRHVLAQPAWEDVEASWERLSSGLFRLEDDLVRLTSLLVSQADRLPPLETLTDDLQAAAAEAAELRELGNRLTEPTDREFVFWVEAAAQSERVTLCAAPLQVGPRLRQALYDDKHATILTSATLTAQGSFRFIKERLALHDATTLRLGSPFDYKRAALVCLPLDIPSPDQPGYMAALEEAIVQLALAAQGRTLVLFTAHAALRAVAKGVKAALAPHDIAVLAQGLDGVPAQLLAVLRTNPRTVLLGAASFWEGIDIVGENLSVLVMARLPFSVPSDPLFAARSELFDDPFRDYALPQAALRLVQGFGRLIRSRTDRGVFVVLDRRIASRSYGSALLASLPPCEVVRLPMSGLGQTVRRWLDRGPPATPTANET